jgi:hypothetical protein
MGPGPTTAIFQGMTGSCSDAASEVSEDGVSDFPCRPLMGVPYAKLKHSGETGGRSRWQKPVPPPLLRNSLLHRRTQDWCFLDNGMLKAVSVRKARKVLLEPVMNPNGNRRTAQCGGLSSVCLRFVFGLSSVCLRFVFGLSALLEASYPGASAKYGC